MQLLFTLPVLVLISQVLAAPVPAVITQTEVVVVTASEPTSSAIPKVGNVVEVIVSKLVQVKASTTETYITTYTTEHPVLTASTSTLSTTPTTLLTPTTSSTSTSTSTSTSATPTTTSTTPVTIEATPSTTSTSTSTSTSTPTTTSTTEAATTEDATTTTEDTTTSTTAESSGATDDFSSAILAEHNTLRAESGADALTWSEELAAYAQAYADDYDCSGTLTHSGGPYGENLALGYTTVGAVDAWYSEKDEYDSSNPVGSHYTQVVWKSTTQLGCGYKTCDNIWGQYTICSYNPAGNVGGEYSENVE